MTGSVLIMAFGSVLLALCYVIFNYIAIRKSDEGTVEMVNIASVIRSGANAFLIAEYKVICPVVAVTASLFSLLVEKTAGLTLIIGAMMSSLACIIGMKSATDTNARTANTARNTLSVEKTIKMALAGGSVSGISVPAFGILGLALIIAIWGADSSMPSAGIAVKTECNALLARLTAYSLGCSLVAMFNRIAGGNYTKAADISSDILAKIRHDLPEDDSRVPNVIADFIGDNVNDIAGNCSDLLESFVAAIVAGILVSASAFPEMAGFIAASSYAILLPVSGIAACIASLLITSAKKTGNDPEKALNASMFLSAGLTAILGLLLCKKLFSQTPAPHQFLFGAITPWYCALLGIVSGIAIGIATERYTSTSYSPARKLAGIAAEGEAFVISKGDALGSRSCLLPTLAIIASLLASGRICGTYGIAISAIGMLSFVGSTVSIDAFGPISDNAGGIAQSCKLGENIRTITDKLDAAGNTTAAIGKGFAIGSATFATISLIASYVSSYSMGTPTLNFASYAVVAGGILGGALVEYFSALLTDNTIESAKAMADEGDRLLSRPGVLKGITMPDYNRMITIATNESLRRMLAPSLLSLLIPVLGGFLFGAQFVGGLLVGATIAAIPRAIFMGNSGGAFDNAKKFIEAGKLEGHTKGSTAHKAAVIGDTVGDTRKDVVGVALDIFIKSMSTVANMFAGLFSSRSLFS